MRYLICSIVIVFAILVASHATAQRLERDPPRAGEPKPQPYLSTSAVDYRSVLAPPPATGSIESNADRRSVEEWQKASEARRKFAALDDQHIYPRFDDAFGRAVDRKTSPTLIRMLNRALRDVAASAFAAKAHFQRLRPYQLFQLQHTCDDEPPPSRSRIRPSGLHILPATAHTAGRLP